MRFYKCLQRIAYNGQLYDPGAILELSDEVVAQLLAARAVEPAAPPAEPVSPDPENETSRTDSTEEKIMSVEAPPKEEGRKPAPKRRLSRAKGASNE